MLWRTVSTKFDADEDVDLAELDLLDVVEVARRAQDDEQRVAVALELGSLVGDDRVLDRQLVQAELLGDVEQQRLRRPEEADPAIALGPLAQQPGRFDDRQRALDAPPRLVDRRVDDARLGRRRYLDGRDSIEISGASSVGSPLGRRVARRVGN